MDVEVVAILASSTVALAAILAGGVQHWSSLRQTRELADLDNLRGVLDRAAEMLHRARYALDDVRLELLQHGGALFEHDRATEALRTLNQCGTECDALVEQLAIRLSRDHEATRALTEADDSLLAVSRALTMIRFEMDPPPDPSAAKQVAKIVDEQREKINTAYDTFTTAREAFTTAAYKTAGARLPRRERRRPWWRRASG